VDGWQQIKQVQADFPSLKVTFGGNKPWYIVWHGKIIGFEKAYEISIHWARWSPWEGFDLATHPPRVYVLNPPLVEWATGEPVPHLYKPAGKKPFLCLYDPKEDPWNGDKLVAETIIPWASQWLRSYEIWQVTGVWPAPGRHPESGECEITSAPSKPESSPAPAVPFSERANALIGRLTGTFVSLPLMVAASGESSHWPSWPIWSKPTLAELQLLLASTSSLEHRQAA